MRIFGSIRARFTGWYLIVLTVLLTVLAVGLFVFVSFTLQRNQDLALENRVKQLAASREVQIALEGGPVEAGLGEIVGFFQRSADGYNIISTRRVENDIELAWIDAALRGEPGFYTVTTSDGVALRFLITLLPSPAELPPPRNVQPLQQSVEAPDPEQPFSTSERIVLLVGQPMSRTLAALATLRRTLLVAIPLTLLLSAGGGLFLVRRVLKPIDRMIATTRDIEESDLGARIAIGSDDELGRLARTLNAMLGRLDRAFQRQRQFTDDASHELRSPLSVIEAEATLALRKDRDTQAYRESLSVIAEESAGMNRLIDQLLTSARGDVGQETLDLRRMDLERLIKETVQTMRPMTEERNLHLSASFPKKANHDLTVHGDEMQLRRVLTNLIENAIRHTEADGKITVSCEERDSMIELIVKDTGCGISEEHLPHVFERFYRADPSRNRQSGGSGLGLAICSQIIEAHHGVISVESELTVGTTFRIQLRGA